MHLRPALFACSAPKLLSALFAVAFGYLPCATGAEPLPAPAAKEMSLEECQAEAQQNNRRRPASRFAVAIAEAQHRQALSGYWPQVTLSGGIRRADEAPNFIFPASFMGIPAQTITTPASTAVVTVPPGVFGPAAVQLPVSVPSQTITTQTQIFPVPAQDVKLMNRDTASGMLDAKWLLYDGGMRKGLNEQTQGLVDAMKQESRRTDLEVADSVHRLYYGAVLARQVLQLGQDTLSRMEATLSLTETMYQGGGGKVSKADFLDNKVMVESLRAMVAALEKNSAMAQAALANTLGRSWRDTVIPRAKEIPFTPFQGNLEELVGTAYRFNPDWARFEAGVRATEGAVRTARSGRHPKVALTGSLHKWWNDYEAGIASAKNKEGWALSLGFELPVFDGQLTQSKIAEAKARLSQMQEQGFLLREGIGLQIKDTFLGFTAAGKAFQATQAASKAAEENRDLNTRAYQQELVDTEKVIRAQLMEALMSAQHLKARYDHVVLQSTLNLLVGTEVLRQLQGAP